MNLAFIQMLNIMVFCLQPLQILPQTIRISNIFKRISNSINYENNLK
jgi:hypothetical protein